MGIGKDFNISPGDLDVASLSDELAGLAGAQLVEIWTAYSWYFSLRSV